MQPPQSELPVSEALGLGWSNVREGLHGQLGFTNNRAVDIDLENTSFFMHVFNLSG